MMQSNSLRTRLALTLIGAILLPTVVVATIAYRELTTTIRDNSVRTVGRIADQRHAQLRQRLLLIQKRTESFLSSLYQRCGAVDGCYRNMLSSHLGSEDALGLVLHIPGRSDIVVGDPMDTSLEPASMKNHQLARFAPRIPGTRRNFFVVATDAASGLRLAVTYPVETVQAIFAEHVDLGKSGESFLADGSGFFITSARYPSVQGHNDPISATPMRRCLTPEDNETLDLDYRDIPIIHGFRFVPEIGGGCIMAHIDQAEAFAPLNRLAKIFAMFLAAAAALAVLAARFLAHVITAPILRLAEISGAIGRGDSGARAEENGYDEVAEMGRAFNAMTARLAGINAELDRKVEERTRELTAANERLAILSSHDELTGLANRRSFDAALKVELPRLRRSGAPLSVILLDVDHFKDFNDTYGHVAGDDCLRRIGAFLSGVVNRAPDLATRYGGEEFAIILPETGLAGALTLAERIRAGIEQLTIPHAASSVADRVTVSLGIVCVTAAEVGSTEDLVRQADERLYQAKAAGRNRVCPSGADD